MEEYSATETIIHEKYIHDSKMFNKYCDAASEIFEQKWKLLDPNFDYEKFLNGEAKANYDDEFWQLRKKYVVELAIYDIRMKEMNRIADYYEKCVNNVGSTYIYQNSNKKKIRNKEKKILEKGTCGICFETHYIRHVITTKCGHHFGKYCLSKYIDYNYEKNLKIVCPMCRNEDLSNFTKYAYE